MLHTAKHAECAVKKVKRTLSMRLKDKIANISLKTLKKKFFGTVPKSSRTQI